MSEELEVVIGIRRYYQDLVRHTAFLFFLGFANFLVVSTIDLNVDMQIEYIVLLYSFALFWLFYHAYFFNKACVGLLRAKNKEYDLKK